MHTVSIENRLRNRASLRRSPRALISRDDDEYNVNGFFGLTANQTLSGDEFGEFVVSVP